MSKETKNPRLDADFAITPAGISKTGTLYRNYPKSAIPADTLVLTPAGFKTARSLTIKDKIISGDGKPARISAICRNDPEDIYKITFKSGRVLYTSGDTAWLPQKDSQENIKRVVTTKDIMERIQTRKNNDLRLNVFMPVNGPVEFDQTQPDYHTIESRNEAVANLFRLYGKKGSVPELRFPSDYDLKRVRQTASILRSLGYNVRRTARVIQIFTGHDLENPNGPGNRLAKPSDFQDEFINVECTGIQEPTICIAPESGVYNYIVQDFCIIHTSIFSGHFEGREPRKPWGTTDEHPVALRYLYPIKQKDSPKPKINANTNPDQNQTPTKRSPRRRRICGVKKRRSDTGKNHKKKSTKPEGKS